MFLMSITKYTFSDSQPSSIFRIGYMEIIHGYSYMFDNKSAKNIANVTAAVAGRSKCVADWRAARDRTGWIEILLTHLRNLGAEHSATTLDERMAGMRTKRHFSGTSAVQEVENRMKGRDYREVCWRNIQDVRQANAASIKSLKKGLLMSRQAVQEKVK